MNDSRAAVTPRKEDYLRCILEAERADLVTRVEGSPAGWESP